MTFGTSQRGGMHGSEQIEMRRRSLNQVGKLVAMIVALSIFVGLVVALSLHDARWGAFAGLAAALTVFARAAYGAIK